MRIAAITVKNIPNELCVHKKQPFRIIHLAHHRHRAVWHRTKDKRSMDNILGPADSSYNHRSGRQDAMEEISATSNRFPFPFYNKWPSDNFYHLCLWCVQPV